MDDPISRDGLIIVINAVGGDPTIPVVYETEPFIIKSECAPGSTLVTINDPIGEPVYPVNENQPQIEIEGTFSSSNPLCGVESIELAMGDEYFDLIVTDNSFKILLRTEYNS